MGREKLLKKLKSTGTMLLIVGVIVALLGLFMTFVMLTDGFHPAVILFLLILVAGGAFIWFGADYIKGENSKFVKNTPNILELADDISDNVVFENDFIIISNKAIAVKKNIMKISALEDVLGIYERIQRTNGIVTSHMVNLELRNGKTIAINVYARKRETKDNLVLTISNYCPNAMVGYTGEMLSYVATQRKEYKASIGK